MIDCAALKGQHSIYDVGYGVMVRYAQIQHGGILAVGGSSEQVICCHSKEISKSAKRGKVGTMYVVFIV